MVAILKNDDHPEYGEVSMPLPIKASEYSHCMELLSSLRIGDALNKDCKVEELTRAYPTLRCLEGCKVNIDELDYLAKRLDGFDAVEVSQFQAIFISPMSRNSEQLKWIWKNSYAREEKNSFLLDGIRGSIEIIA